MFVAVFCVQCYTVHWLFVGHIQRFEKEAAARKKSEDALKAAQRKLSDREAQLATVNQEAKNLEGVILELRKECQELKDALESAKYALEQETLSRVDLENKLQSKEEELNFKKEMYNKVKVSEDFFKNFCSKLEIPSQLLIIKEIIFNCHVIKPCNL